MHLLVILELILASELANRFCEHSDFGMMMEETETVQSHFSSLYNVPDQIKEHYFKLKVIEIFYYYLLSLQLILKREVPIGKQQVDIVKAVSEYVSTVYEAYYYWTPCLNSLIFLHLPWKRCFKGVFVYNHVVSKRMSY